MQKKRTNLSSEKHLSSPTPSRIGDAPIQKEYVDSMQEVARFVDRLFNGEAQQGDRKIAWVLMAFPFNDGDGRCNYISNADRNSIVTLLKEQLAYFEGMPAAKGAA